MPMPNFYAATAAALLVSLGLGLIYLVVMDRLAAGAAIGILLGAASLIPVVAVLRDLDRDQPPRGRRRPDGEA